MRNGAGFTLIEMLIVIAITTALAIGGTINYLGLRNKKALDSMVSRIVFDLRAASERSKAQENDVRWGIRFENGATDDYYEIWGGASYEDELVLKTGRTNLSFINFTDPAEGVPKDIIFERATGIPRIADCNSESGATSCAISFENSKGVKTITVNSNGRIDY